MDRSSKPEAVRFGVFDLDLRARELRKQGRRVALQDKPFEVLAMLVERSGALVSREELQHRLWPGDTFVVFDDNLNAAVKKVRDALGDSPDGARFVETVPRRGYKFVGPIEALPAGPAVAAPPEARSPGWRRHGIAATVVSAALALGAFAAWELKPDPRITNAAVQFPYTLPADQQFTRTGNHLVAISRDGTLLTYVADKRLYLRRLDQLDARPIPGTDENPMEPMFAPDGQSIAYFVPTENAKPGSLRRIPITGGQSERLCDAEQPNGASWTEGTIVFAQTHTIEAVRDSGGTPKAIVTVDSTKIGKVAQPHLIDHNRRVLFTIRPLTHAFDDEAEIVVQTLGTEDRRTVLRGWDGRLLARDRMLFFRDRTVYVVTIDPGTMLPAGEPAIVQEGVRSNSEHATAQFAVSDNGTFVYVAGSALSPRTLVWVNAQGDEEPIAAPPRAYLYVRASPNGRMLAMDSRDGEQDLWVWDIAQKVPTRVTSGSEEDRAPLWMPNGRDLIFTRQNQKGGASYDLYRTSWDRPGSLERLTRTESVIYASALAPDGSIVAWQYAPDGRQTDVVFLPTVKDHPQPLLASPHWERNPVVSRDGRWLAYERLETGATEVWVQPFSANASEHWRLSPKRGDAPLWSRDGSTLFYRSGTHLVAVSVGSGPPSAWPQRDMFPIAGYYRSTVRNYDEGTDGRLVFLKVPPSSAVDRQRFVVIANRFDRLGAGQ